jgi:radical S-adenosyl methionine domain-containing protein 2
MLPVYGPNAAINGRQFSEFLERHSEFANIIVSEDNHDMTGSYLMIDPLGRFFWRAAKGRATGYRYSDSVSRVGAKEALRQSFFVWDKYVRRYV